MGAGSDEVLKAMQCSGARLRNLADFVAFAVLRRSGWNVREKPPSLMREVPNVKRAVDLSYDSATDAIRRLQGGVASTKRESGPDGDANDVDAPYLRDGAGLREALRGRLAEIEGNVEALVASEEATVAALNDFATFLNEKPAGRGGAPPQELMRACLEFAQTMDDSFKFVCASLVRPGGARAGATENVGEAAARAARARLAGRDDRRGSV